tara:strand:- start:378 stop:578 length:201 start_codon:yes stop_codon:yes gene_type:complete
MEKKEKMIISDENVLRMYKNIIRKGNVSEETKSQIVDGLNQLIQGKSKQQSRVRLYAESILEEINK